MVLRGNDVGHLKAWGKICPNSDIEPLGAVPATNVVVVYLHAMSIT